MYLYIQMLIEFVLFQHPLNPVLFVLLMINWGHLLLIPSNLKDCSN